MVPSTTEMTVYFTALALLFGAVCASFLDCAAWRIVRGESFLRGRSRCDACGHTLGIGDLVPVFSYLFHKGKCRYCGAHISACHVVFELIGAAGAVGIVHRYGISILSAEYLLFFCILMGVSFTDIYGYEIPDGFILGGIGLWVVFLFVPGFSLSVLIDGLIGGFAVAGALLVTVLITEKVLKREAMGGGDIKLLFLTGLFLGWKRNILLLFIACIAGIVTGVATQRRREADETAEDKKIFPWGPSIAIAAYITLLFGEAVIEGYLSLF